MMPAVREADIRPSTVLRAANSNGGCDLAALIEIAACGTGRPQP